MFFDVLSDFFRICAHNVITFYVNECFAWNLNPKSSLFPAEKCILSLLHYQGCVYAYYVSQCKFNVFWHKNCAYLAIYHLLWQYESILLTLVGRGTLKLLQITKLLLLFVELYFFYFCTQSFSLSASSHVHPHVTKSDLGTQFFVCIRISYICSVFSKYHTSKLFFLKEHKFKKVKSLDISLILGIYSATLSQ